MEIQSQPCIVMVVSQICAHYAHEYLPAGEGQHSLHTSSSLAKHGFPEKRCKIRVVMLVHYRHHGEIRNKKGLSA